MNCFVIKHSGAAWNRSYLVSPVEFVWFLLRRTHMCSISQTIPLFLESSKGVTLDRLEISNDDLTKSCCLVGTRPSL